MIMMRPIKCIILIISISTLIVIISANFIKADEPPNISSVIMISSIDSKQEITAPVLEDGIGNESKAKYKLIIENLDSVNDRNVTLKFQWIEELEGWNCSALPSNFTIRKNDSEEVNITVLAPNDTEKYQKTILKVYVWEYEEINKELDNKYKNTTLGNDYGEVILTTIVVPEEGWEITCTQENLRKIGYPNQVTRFYFTVRRLGYSEDAFDLYHKYDWKKINDGDFLLGDAIDFPNCPQLDMKWNQEIEKSMDILINPKLPGGVYSITIHAHHATRENLVVILEIVEPDLYFIKEDIHLSHDSILNGQKLEFSLTTGNKGSIITDKFTVDIFLKNSEGGWTFIDSKDIIGLEYQEEKTISFKIKISSAGNLIFLCNINPNRDIIEGNYSNNKLEINIQSVNAAKVSNSFNTEMSNIFISVGLVSFLSIIGRNNKRYLR